MERKPPKQRAIKVNEAALAPSLSRLKMAPRTQIMLDAIPREIVKLLNPVIELGLSDEEIITVLDEEGYAARDDLERFVPEIRKICRAVKKAAAASKAAKRSARAHAQNKA